MVLKANQLYGLYNTLCVLRETSMPFKSSILINRNFNKLMPEYELQLQSELKFMDDYLEKNEDGSFKELGPGKYTIKAGKEEECRQARAYLDNFEIDVQLYPIPEEYLYNLELTPVQLDTLDCIIIYKEEKENE